MKDYFLKKSNSSISLKIDNISNINRSNSFSLVDVLNKEKEPPTKIRLPKIVSGKLKRNRKNPEKIKNIFYLNNLNYLDYLNNSKKILTPQNRTPLNSSGKIDNDNIKTNHSKDIDIDDSYLYIGRNFPKRKIFTTFKSTKDKRNKSLLDNNDKSKLTLKENDSQIKDFLKKNISLSPISFVRFHKKKFFFSFPKEKLNSPFIFHKEIMKKNIATYNKAKLNDYIKLIKEKENEIKRKSEYKVTTGIFGPSDNLFSIIRARLERQRIEYSYPEAQKEIKEIIKDEIMNAQVKLGRKPKKLYPYKNNNIVPSIIQKMQKYKYLSCKNKLLELNQFGKLPEIINDGEIIHLISGNEFDAFKSNKFILDYQYQNP